MKRGEIWHVDLDPTAGQEQQGRRYVLIVSPDAFNRVTGLSMVVPITSGGGSARHRGFAVSLSGAVRGRTPRAWFFATSCGRWISSPAKESEKRPCPASFSTKSSPGSRPFSNERRDDRRSVEPKTKRPGSLRALTSVSAVGRL
jgi:hypothetical protein